MLRIWQTLRAMATLIQMREFIRSALERKSDKTQRGIAAATGIDPTGVSRILSGGRKISADEWHQICVYLEIDPATGEDVAPAHKPPVQASRNLSSSGNEATIANVSDVGAARAPAPGSGDMPVWGTAGGMAAGEVIFMNVGEPTWTKRPGILEGVTGAFGVYVLGNSMEPAFKQGWIVWVDPHRPIAPGDDVVVELKSGQAYIKNLVRRTAKAVICEQWNPKTPVEYPTSEVKRLYLIVGSTRVRA